MVKLTDVFRADDKTFKLGKRQLPFIAIAGDNLMMVMDLNSKGLVIDCPLIRSKELDEFTRKFNLLTNEELRNSLTITREFFMSVLSQTVQCVGCRRSVERLLNQAMANEYPTLDPIVLRNSQIITVSEEKMKTPQALGTLLYKHHEVLNNLLENKLRNKTRCLLHSLDSFRSRPFSETWVEVWNIMKQRCKQELAVIEAEELHEVLESYLKKHKFCQECRTKVEKAFSLLIGEITVKEKGFNAARYAQIKKCTADRHIHVQSKELICDLIRKAEPEVNGTYSKQRERHAKTLEIAQEEVLTCVGIVMYERIRRIYVSIREEERACQVLAAVAVHSLYRSFDTFVEKKQGISNLELLYKEISREEKAKEYKREQKKLKKRKKKDEKKNTFRTCEMETMNNNNFSENPSDGEESTRHDIENCDDFKDEIVDYCPCEAESDVYTKSIDAGYGTDPASHVNSRTSSVVSTPEGSEVSCSDGFCNHGHNPFSEQSNYDKFDLVSESEPYLSCQHTKSSLSLQQMLNAFDVIEHDENYYIPDEVVFEFNCHKNKIKQMRKELRENLQQKFAQFCEGKVLLNRICK